LIQARAKAVAKAIIVKVCRPCGHGGLEVWYEFAPMVNGVPRRRPDHMMASAEGAAKRARAFGYDPTDELVEIEVS
jgi:hypothetical protein